MEDCRFYQLNIAAFDEERLSYKAERAFIDHVSECPDCREELEIYNIIEYGLNDYDEKKVDPKYLKFINVFDFKGLVESELKDRASYLDWFKDNERTMNMVLLFTDAVVFVVALILYIIKFC